MRLLRLALLLTIPMSAAFGQSMGAHGVLTRITPTEFGSPLGFGISLEQPIAKNAVRWHLGFEGVWGTHAYVGSPCSGLIPIGSPACADQPLRNSTDMQSMIVGLRVPLIWTKRASLSLAGDIGAVRIASQTLDSTDVKRLSAWRFMYRREFGIEGRIRPRAAKPWSVNAGYAVGSVRPFVQSGIADGYTPFDQPLLTRRAWLGVIVAIDPATGQRRRR